MALAALPTLSVDGATVSPDMVFAAVWLGSMGVAGLVLSGDPLRVAPAVLTILTGFDLIYAGLEPSLAIVGLLGALTLLAAMSFSYLAMIRALRSAPAGASNEEVEA
jgi:hypothetical protein